MAPVTAKRARFGPFEFDPRTGELQGPDGTVRLTRQHSQLLEILLEHAPDIAARDEIEKKLWPNTTFIEFEISIRAAMRKLRRALGDSVRKPRYVETIKRFGYRLMVSVEWVDGPSKIPRSNSSFQVDKLSGLIISHYRLEEIIGRGGMGIVYRAYDQNLYRSVALKFLPEELATDEDAHARFRREARAVASLDHPNICPIYEFGECEEHPFIAMQLLEGATLREHLAAGRFRLTKVAGLGAAIQVARGLKSAHENGVVHRDIKPANIFITDKGRVKILDFGVAFVLAAGETIDGVPPSEKAFATDGNVYHPSAKSMKVGTAGYMSPEQIRGEPLDAGTDIFSFGLVLYEMATGQRAYDGERDMVHNAILNLEPRLPRQLAPDISPGVEEIICKCLQKRRAHRFATAEELAKALRREIKDDHRRRILGEVRYYLYVSDRKLAMIWPQIPSATVMQVASASGLELPETSNETDERGYRLKIVESFLDQTGQIGTVSNPKAYIIGHMKACTGILPGSKMLAGLLLANAPPYLYFGGDEDGKAVALLGSPRHLIGAASEPIDINSRGAYAYLLPAILDVLKRDAPVTDERDVSYYINWVNHDTPGEWQRIDYLARVLIHSDRSIVATPIYVSLSEP